MWIYVLEQPIAGTDDFIVKYCSLNDATLQNYANTNNINGNITQKFIFFNINGLTTIYSVVVEKNEQWVDVVHYCDNQAKLTKFVTDYSYGRTSPKVKVDTIQVI